MVYCPECGTKNNKTSNVCKDCGTTLIKPEYYESSEYTDFDQLFTAKNKKKLNEMSFSVSAYGTILQNIYSQARDKYADLLDDIPPEDYQKMDVLSKVAIITMAFTKIGHKSRGADLGNYAFNLIRVDDRLDTVHQATTLIHELTHHLVAEIFEQSLMYLLEAKKSDVIESYVSFALGSNPSSVLMNEYCAHMVEGRFVPHGYQNFGSFINILQNYDSNKEEDRQLVHQQQVIGGSLSIDILKILEEFITPELRNEILEVFRNEAKFPPQYDQINLEINEELPVPVKVFIINSILSQAFEPAQEANLHGVLNEFKENFNMINKS